MVTSHDVARLAGVSQPTVSRALRGIGVSAEAIEKVRAAAVELGYVPSEAGRTLSTRRTRCIGIVAGELTNPFYPELIEPMRAELERSGYRALLIPDADGSPVEIERLSDGTLDGVLLTTSTTSSRLPGDLNARGIPFVLVNRLVDGIESDRCTFDNASGARAIADAMVSRGHTRIGMISGSESTTTGRERDLSFRQRLTELDVQLDETLVRHGPFTFETGARGARELLAAQQPPTAIFCGNDVIAIGALNAQANATGDSHRVAIVGFDDIAMSSWDLLRITTVAGDLAEMARQSVRLVLRRIEDPGAEFEEVILPTRLVERTPI
jgi:LacI family transcriptional regulator